GRVRRVPPTSLRGGSPTPRGTVRTPPAGAGLAASDQALCEHRVGDPHEARGVRAEHVVAGATVALGGVVGGVVHIAHDGTQPRLAVFETPALKIGRAAWRESVV